MGTDEDRHPKIEAPDEMTLDGKTTDGELYSWWTMMNDVLQSSPEISSPEELAAATGLTPEQTERAHSWGLEQLQHLTSAPIASWRAAIARGPQGEPDV